MQLIVTSSPVLAHDDCSLMTMTMMVVMVVVMVVMTHVSDPRVGFDMILNAYGHDYHLGDECVG